METNNLYQSNAKSLLLAFTLGFLLGRKLKGYRRHAKAKPGVIPYEGEWDYPLPATCYVGVDLSSTGDFTCLVSPSLKGRPLRIQSAVESKSDTDSQSKQVAPLTSPRQSERRNGND